jgi:hypothetical protein
VPGRGKMCKCKHSGIGRVMLHAICELLAT